MHASLKIPPHFLWKQIPGVRRNSGKVAGKDDKVVLYSYFRSSSAWRVRIALAFKGIQYEYKAVHLLNGEQKDPEFLKVNPLGQVPVLLIDGHKLTQSVSILEYLEETRTQMALLSGDSHQRAEIREFVEIINSSLQPVTNLGVLKQISSQKEKQVDWLRHWGNKDFTVLEKFLRDSSGQYCFGDSVTLADLFLVPATASAERWGIDLKEYPTILSIVRRLSELKAFKAAHPTAQPDCPEKLRSATNK